MKVNKIKIINYKETIQLTITDDELYSLEWALIFVNDMDHTNKRVAEKFNQLKKDLEKIRDQSFDTNEEFSEENKKNKKPVKWNLCKCGIGYLGLDYKNKKAICRKCGISKVVKIAAKLHKDYEKILL